MTFSRFMLSLVLQVIILQVAAFYAWTYQGIHVYVMYALPVAIWYLVMTRPRTNKADWFYVVTGIYHFVTTVSIAASLYYQLWWVFPLSMAATFAVCVLMVAFNPMHDDGEAMRLPKLALFNLKNWKYKLACLALMLGPAIIGAFASQYQSWNTFMVGMFVLLCITVLVFRVTRRWTPLESITCTWMLVMTFSAGHMTLLSLENLPMDMNNHFWLVVPALLITVMIALRAKPEEDAEE